jgi:hypothetical protein
MSKRRSTRNLPGPTNVVKALRSFQALDFQHDKTSLVGRAGPRQARSKAAPRQTGR